MKSLVKNKKLNKIERNQLIFKFLLLGILLYFSNLIISDWEHFKAGLLLTYYQLVINPFHISEKSIF
jgi:hypothetical protein